jgi:hypothetical protein
VGHTARHLDSVIDKHGGKVVVVVAGGGSVQVVVGCRVFDLRSVASRWTEGRNGKGRRKGEERRGCMMLEMRAGAGFKCYPTPATNGEGRHVV